jgi:SAM-dependent methyltransferase
MSSSTHQKDLEAYYKTQVGGRTVFWKDKYKPYLSLYRDRLIKRNATIAAACPASMDCALDLGCGQGDLLAMLSPLTQMVIGMDYAEVMVRVARDNLTPYKNTHLMCSPAEVLPLKDGTLNAILLADVVEHLRDPLACLIECRRTLRPGGLVIITTPNASVERFWKAFDGGLAKPFRIFSRRARKEQPGIFEHLYTRAELALMADRSGLIIQEHRMIEFFPGSEGSGTFGRVLRLIARQKQIREWLVEPVFRAVFGLIEGMGTFNNRQFMVLRKP